MNNRIDLTQEELRDKLYDWMTKGYEPQMAIPDDLPNEISEILFAIDHLGLIAELKKRYEEIDALLGTIGSWGYVMCPRSNEWFEWDYGCQSEICTSHDDDCRELV
jgi:hypothetical protein